MRLTAGTLVGGLPARRVRPVLRRMQVGATTPGRFAEEAGLDDDGAVELLAALLDEGSWHPAAPRSAPWPWVTTAATSA